MDPQQSPNKEFIHKRMMDTRLLGDMSWTLCNPSVSFSGSYGILPGFIEWTFTNNFYWKNVTCPECLKLRGKGVNKMRMS